MGKLARSIGGGLRTAAKIWREARAASAEHRVGAGRILTDAVALRTRHSLGILDYFRYRLYDPRLTRQEKLRYLSSANLRADLSSRLTPPRYRALYANKLIFQQFFEGAGLPLARIYAVYDPAVGHTAEGRSLRNATDLRAWMESFGGDGFVFKAAQGEQGRQILVFTERVPGDRAGFVTMAGERYDAEGLVRFATTVAREEHRLGRKRYQPGRDDSFLLQERLRPHPALAAFVGPTLCCVRVQTFVALDGTPRLLGSVFKLQPGRLGVDHLLYGAVGCWVDPDTGALGRGRTRDSQADVTLIPGTDRSFVGFQLPHWAELKALALRAAAAFPWARAIGWDIGITDRGPVLVEGNPAWSPSLIQLPAPSGLFAGEFKALCDSLRHG